MTGCDVDTTTDVNVRKNTFGGRICCYMLRPPKNCMKTISVATASNKFVLHKCLSLQLKDCKMNCRGEL